MAGLTAEGLIIKRYSEILEEKKQRAIARFLDLVPPGDTVDVSDGTTLGRLIALSVPGEADLWEAIQEVYSAFDPNASFGLALDDLVAIGGISRHEAQKSFAPVLVTGEVGTIIPSGSTVRATASTILWEFLRDVEISADDANGVGLIPEQVQSGMEYVVSFTTSGQADSVTYTSSEGDTAADIIEGIQNLFNDRFPEMLASIVGNRLVIEFRDPFRSADWETSSNLPIIRARNRSIVQATTFGRNLQDANTLTTIQTPVLGWESVYNPAPATPGRLEETDDELRVRFRDSKFVRASSILESLYTSILSINGVSEVRVYENDTDDVDQYGIPPHSFMPIVEGGSDSEIANAIWQNRPLGITSYGNTNVPIVDSQSYPHTVSFERPSALRVYIQMNISTYSDFPTGGPEEIKGRLVEYFLNMRVGEDVVYSRLYTPINSIPGHQVNSLLIGTDPSQLSPSNIEVAFNKVATLARADIEVVVEEV